MSYTSILRVESGRRRFSRPFDLHRSDSTYMTNKIYVHVYTCRYSICSSTTKAPAPPPINSRTARASPASDHWSSASTPRRQPAGRRAAVRDVPWGRSTAASRRCRRGQTARRGPAAWQLAGRWLRPRRTFCRPSRSGRPSRRPTTRLNSLRAMKSATHSARYVDTV